VHALAVGFGFGFFVAAQVGPMSLFLIRSTLRRGWGTGLAIGAGIAVIDTAYCILGVAGAGALLAIHPLRLVLGLVGAVVLVFLGVKTLWSALRVRLGGEVPSEVASPRRAFLTSLAGTASNPLTIASWIAIFAAASTAGIASRTSGATLLVVGGALGSATWLATLATGVAVARRAFGERMLRAADGIAGAGLIGFGGALAYSTIHEAR
jgi:putative LysE/RhtB family amino acid efflux pump